MLVANSLCKNIFLIFFSKFPVFSLSGKMDFQIPCFPCAVATLFSPEGLSNSYLYKNIKLMWLPSNGDFGAHNYLKIPNPSSHSNHRKCSDISLQLLNEDYSEGRTPFRLFSLVVPDYTLLYLIT